MARAAPKPSYAPWKPPAHKARPFQMKIFLTEEKCVINLILFLRALRGAAGNAVGNQKSPGAAPYELFLAVTDVPAAALGQAEAKGSS